ncbi:MAG: DUF5916 domain-containing protein, partial [Gemmatimonadales bacterium]
MSFRGIRSRRPFFITPYAATRRSTNSALASDLSRYQHDEELDFDAGGDLKYALSNNLNLDLTVNTDFAEVEVDDERVNLTRFSLFFPERRQFFLEREGTFDFGVSGLDRLFYSRRIGLTDDGRTVPIIAGGRLTGRAAGFDVGVLDMHTASDAGQPAENLGVLRVRKSLDDGGSYVGLMGTSRVGGGDHSILLGGDLEVRFRQNDYLTAEITRAFDSRPDSGDGTLPSGRARIQFERRSLRGLGGSLAAGLTGSDYRPTLGFVQRKGIWDASADISYGFLTRTAGLRRISPSISGSIVGTNGRSNIETWNAGAGMDLEFTSSAVLSAALTATHEDLAQGFALDEGTQVPPGNYRFTRIELGLTPSQGWTSGAGLRTLIGGFFDGNVVSFGVSPFWNISPYVRVTADYSFDRVAFESRSEEFTAHVVRLRPEVSLDSRLSTVATLQYNSILDVAT